MMPLKENFCDLYQLNSKKEREKHCCKLGKILMLFFGLTSKAFCQGLPRLSGCKMEIPFSVCKIWDSILSWDSFSSSKAGQEKEALSGKFLGEK